VNEIGTGAAWDHGEWLVVEADESDGTFLELSPAATIVTNVEPDHLDHYGGFAALVDAFATFLERAPGPNVVGADEPTARRLASAAGAITYGIHESATYRMHDLSTSRSGARFELRARGEPLVRVELPVAGAHNATNAAGAIAMAVELGVAPDVAAGALARYGGVARRFQFRGTRDDVTFIDDYAHLPGEVRAALSAAAAGGWERIVCVFQPHRYSRTARLAATFAHAFSDADVLVVTDVYGAGEAPRPGVSGKLVLDAVLDAHPFRPAAYVPRRPELVAYLRRVLRAGDLCLTLGAGDLTSLPDELLAP
jgi:UDP-N-acetylmuramate--alanine ligase